MSLQTYFVLLSGNSDSLLHDSAEDCSSFTARLSCPLRLAQKCFLPQPIHSRFPARPWLLLLCTRTCPCPCVHYHSICFPRLELPCSLLWFWSPQGSPDRAFEGNFENVIGQNEKISSDLFQFDISIGLALFAYNFSAP